MGNLTRPPAVHIPIIVAVAGLAADERPWTEIPGVRVVGLVFGVALLIAAIRYMFKR